MITISNIKTYGFEAAIRGMRNPMNSWDLSDSKYDENGNYIIGPKDLHLCNSLAQAGPEHAKFTRYITVSMDITAPLYWWKEYDTYKVGTVANSCSTMHTIHKRDLELEDFSTEGLEPASMDALKSLLVVVNFFRQAFVASGRTDKNAWEQIIKLLPESYNQKRTVMFNYQVGNSIVRQRRGHKLKEWHTLVNTIEELPYYREIFEEEKE